MPPDPKDDLVALKIAQSLQHLGAATGTHGYATAQTLATLAIAEALRDIRDLLWEKT